MRAYVVILNGKRSIVKAQCWMQAFKLAMVGRSKVPNSLVIKPYKKRKQTVFNRVLPSMLRPQAGLFSI